MIEIKSVLILGAGTLGSRIGLQAAISGYSVTIYDIHESALQQAQKVMDKVLRYTVKIGLTNLPPILKRLLSMPTSSVKA
jgi:3-hydroxybutyryl-CoA dehydrogenase